MTCFVTLTCILCQVQKLFVTVISLVTVTRLTLAHVCPASPNTTAFERQLQHLHYLPNDVRFPNHSESTFVDDSRCNTVPNVSPVFLNERSICPWDMVENVNEDRYPQVLNFARCRCSKCLSEFGNFECRPVSYRIPVFEKRCVGDRLEYIKTYTDVPVGCTCSKPRVISVSKRVLDLFRRRVMLRRTRNMLLSNMEDY